MDSLEIWEYLHEELRELKLRYENMYSPSRGGVNKISDKTPRETKVIMKYKKSGALAMEKAIEFVNEKIIYLKRS